MKVQLPGHPTRPWDSVIRVRGSPNRVSFTDAVEQIAEESFSSAHRAVLQPSRNGAIAGTAWTFHWPWM
jgi:hypothetical protein